LQKELHNTINKSKMMLETDKNLGIEEYYMPSDKQKEGFDNTQNKQKLLEDLEKKVLKCEKCKLYKTRTNLVFGEGNADAQLMFVGEAPGRDEDLQGKPFVGRAGKLLDKIIKAMNLKREDIYIANILKDRPPNNRNPKDEEIEACKPFLLEQIKIIQPKVICALGSFAARELLETEEAISKLRGRFHNYKNIRLMPTYHPAYLLRNPQAKREVWEDMKKIMRELENNSHTNKHPELHRVRGTANQTRIDTNN
jgi:DNA polymerase